MCHFWAFERTVFRKGRILVKWTADVGKWNLWNLVSWNLYASAEFFKNFENVFFSPKTTLKSCLCFTGTYLLIFFGQSGQIESHKEKLLLRITLFNFRFIFSAAKESLLTQEISSEEICYCEIWNIICAKWGNSRSPLLATDNLDVKRKVVLNENWAVRSLKLNQNSVLRHKYDLSLR